MDIAMHVDEKEIGDDYLTQIQFEPEFGESHCDWFNHGHSGRIGNDGLGIRRGSNGRQQVSGQEGQSDTEQK
ncbi:MAG: hypothetical protein OEM91_08835 [Hyphomicrobiales bacterium]|nr:hypothetical protein [Hyphomicrobiales bacterium]